MVGLSNFSTTYLPTYHYLSMDLPLGRLSSPPPQPALDLFSSTLEQFLLFIRQLSSFDFSFFFLSFYHTFAAHFIIRTHATPHHARICRFPWALVTYHYHTAPHRTAPHTRIQRVREIHLRFFSDELSICDFWSDGCLFEVWFLEFINWLFLVLILFFFFSCWWWWWWWCFVLDLLGWGIEDEDDERRMMNLMFSSFSSFWIFLFVQTLFPPSFKPYAHIRTIVPKHIGFLFSSNQGGVGGGNGDFYQCFCDVHRLGLVCWDMIERDKEYTVIYNAVF